jgi:hypothetical protein
MMLRALLAISIGLVGGALFLGFGLATGAFAHDHNRPELNGWYQSLKNQNKMPCCDGSDAKHVNDLDWETQAKERSHFRVRIDGKWIDVPDEAVITEHNKAGFALEWHGYHDGEPFVRCFMPGQMA